MLFCLCSLVVKRVAAPRAFLPWINYWSTSVRDTEDLCRIASLSCAAYVGTITVCSEQSVTLPPPFPSCGWRMERSLWPTSQTCSVLQNHWIKKKWVGVGAHNPSANTTTTKSVSNTSSGKRSGNNGFIFLDSKRKTRVPPLKPHAREGEVQFFLTFFQICSHFGCGGPKSTQRDPCFLCSFSFCSHFGGGGGGGVHPPHLWQQQWSRQHDD